MQQGGGQGNTAEDAARKMWQQQQQQQQFGKGMRRQMKLAREEEAKKLAELEEKTAELKND